MKTKNVTIQRATLSIFLTLFLTVFVSVLPAQAAEKRSKKSSKKAHKSSVHAPSKSQAESDRNQALKRAEPDQKVGVIKQNLSTDMTFSDLNLTGKRQSPFGSQVTVEDEKGIPSLVDYRKNFKDRAEATQFGR